MIDALKSRTKLALSFGSKTQSGVRDSLVLLVSHDISWSAHDIGLFNLLRLGSRLDRWGLRDVASSMY